MRREETQERGAVEDAEWVAGSKLDAGGDELGSLFVVQRTGELLHVEPERNQVNTHQNTQQSTRRILGFMSR